MLSKFVLQIDLGLLKRMRNWTRNRK